MDSVIVKPIFLVPNDKSNEVLHIAEIKESIEGGLKFIQNWINFKLKKMETFYIDSLKTINSDKDSEWFLYYPNNNYFNYNSPKFNSFYNSISELQQNKLHANKCNIFLCFLFTGHQGCALDYYSFLPDRDILMLHIENLMYDFSIIGDRIEKFRWLGGLAHELFHSFGLEDYYNEDKSGFLMGDGFKNFPNTNLRPEDLKILNSLFINCRDIPNSPPVNAFLGKN